MIQINDSKETPVNLSDFPCYTQAGERTITLVTDVSSSVVAGGGNRDGYIILIIEGRNKLSVFQTK